ncbi:unnamed protein product [Paramecium sonneborni]|uniref:EF-hand domain-containing protein n=1 Tax=Paramecium sonneborni TaxID=65129 RepID=A0A8S1P2U8_9CILI|nr:unnamed protein product [Paramecium sonneborni]
MKVNVQENQFQKQLPNISKTPQAKSQQTLEQIFNTTLKQPRQLHDHSMKSLHNISNVSFIRNERHDIKQDQYYTSPLLNKTQLLEIERQSKQRKNEMYSQMLSENPFKFNDSQEEMILEHPRKVSSIHVNLFDLKDKEKLTQLLQETSEFSDKLSIHNPQIKPANVIVQRQDVIKLAQWIDYQMKIIVEDTKLKEDQMLHQVEHVFNQSLKELIREISLDCIEKGVLLEKIWNQYVNFNNIVIQAIQQEKINSENEYLNDLKQVHQTYQISVQVLEDKIKLIESQMQSLQYKYNEKVVDYDNLLQKYEYLFNQYKELKSEDQELKNDYSIAMNDIEQLNQKINNLQIENQKILKQLNDRINYNFQKSKRQSYIFSDTDALYPDHKSTSCYDLYTTMEIHVNQASQTTQFSDLRSSETQTDFKYFKQVAIQCSDLIFDESSPKSNFQNEKINNNSQQDEVRKLKELTFALEERIRMEVQAQNELRKQRQLIQRESDSQKIKITNLENTITQLQIDIDNLQMQIDNKQDTKQKEITVVSMDQKNSDQQMSLAPQLNNLKTQQKQETQHKTQENLPEIKQGNQQKKKENNLDQAKQIQKLQQSQQQQQQQQQQQMKQTNTNSFNKVKSVDVKDQKKSVKIIKNSQIIPRKTSQDSIHNNISQETDNNNANSNEDFLSKALEELTKDGRQLKLTQNQNQRVSIVQQRRQTQQQNYILIQQEKQQQILQRLLKDKKENIYVDVALAFINQLHQDFKLNPNQVENTLTIQNSLKQISLFYKEKLDSKYPLYAICYEYYMNQYGLKNVAEQKMTQFCQSLIVYQQNYRIKLFARFLQLYDNISNDDFEFYIQSLNQLDEHQNSQNLISCTPSQDCVMVLFQKVKQQLQIFNNTGKELIDKLMVNIKNIKGEQYLDLDQYYLEALEQFQFIRKIQNDNFNQLFLAIDVNDDQKISQNEFNILYSLIEDNKNILKYKKLFQLECQNCEGLNFYQFGVFCMHNNLFTKQKQDKFFFSNQAEQSLIQLKITWGHQRKIISQRLRDSNNFTQYYQDLIRKLDEGIKHMLGIYGEYQRNNQKNLYQIINQQI